MSELTSQKRITILDIPIDNLTENEALTQIATFLANGDPHQIVTVNPEFVMEAQQNEPFREVLCKADLASPDGFGLVLAARWLRNPLRGRVTGVALTHRIAALAAKKGYRLFLLGAAPGVAEQAAQVLQETYLGLQIVGGRRILTHTSR